MMSRQHLKERYEGCQTFLEEGCLFLTLCSIAEEETGEDLDILAVLAYCKKQGYIDSDGNMTAATQCQMLRDLTGKDWTREEMKELPNPVPNEMYTVEKWVSAVTGYTHFRRRFMDTLVNSQTVAKGGLVTYYCYIIL